MNYNTFIPHGHCYLWKPGLVWLHLVSDSLIALAYYSIPIALIYLVNKRKDLPFNWIFLLFGTFIVACGTTHIMDVWTLWHPTYWLSGTIKALTAAVSLTTAVMLIPLVPQILAIPSQEQLQQQIAEREKAEAALNASQKRIAGILDIAYDAIISVDNSQCITMFNQGAEKIFGFSTEEILGQSLDLLIPSSFVEIHRQHVQQFANSSDVARGMGEHREIIARRKNGSEFPAEASISKLELEGETIFTAILRDISDRIAARRDRIIAQQALQYSEERLRLTLEATRIGIWDWNLLTNEITWNDNHATLFGLVPGTFEVSYQAFRDRVHPEDIERLETAVERALTTKTDFWAEYRVIWLNGNIRWIEGKGRGFYDADGKAVRMMGTVMDISDRKRQEAAISRAYDELERRVQQRTNQLFEANLALRTEIAEREWAERGVTVQYATTAVLAEAVNLAEMYSRILPAICKSLGWDWGEFWIAGHSNDSSAIDNRQLNQSPITNYQSPITSLQCTEIWQSPAMRSQQFQTITESTIFAPRVGLPGRVWATGKAIWIPDVVQDENFQRAEIAREIGLHAAIAFPVRIGREILGVITCFSRQIKPSDADLLDLMTNIGNQIGQYIQRKQAEETIQEIATLQQAILNSANYTIISTTVDGTIRTFNAAAERMLGYTAAEVIGKTTPVIIHDRDQVWQRAEELSQELGITIEPGFEAFVAKARQGEVDEREWSYIRKDGSRFPILLSVTALYDGENNITGFLGIGSDISERKQAQEAMQRYAAEIEDLYNNAPCGYHSLDADGNVVRINDTELNMLGYAREEIIGKHLTDLLAPNSLAIFQENFPRFIENGWLHDLELNYIRKDGTILPVSLNATALKDDAGNYLMSRSTIFDLSDRKQAQEELRQSEERLQLALEGSGDGLWDWQIATGEVYVSPRWLSMLGYEVDELTVDISIWESLIHPDDRPWVMDVLNNHLKDSLVPYTFEYRVRTKSGECKWIGNYGKVVARDQHGNPLRMTGTHKDISDRKAAEAEIRNLNRALEIAVVGISQLDVSGRFIKVNAEYASLLGYHTEEIIGMDWQLTVHPEDREKTISAYQQMLANDKAEVEVRAVRKDGSSFDQKIVMVKADDQQQQFTGHYGFMKDISDRREIERLKDEFISIVSHELRTPLTSISGALDLLASGLLQAQPEEAQRMLNIAANNTERLVRLINDILDIERIESGKVTMTKQVTEAGNLMLQSAEVVQDMARNAGITLSISPLQTNLWADPDRIIQVLTNLLSNAIKFSSPGSTVWLSAEIQVAQREEDALTLLRSYAGTEEDAGNVSAPLSASPRLPLSASSPASSYVLFTVTDQGRGIPADKLQLIFEPFQQVDASDSRSKGGTGLGLAICRSILQQHNGQIWAVSTLGEGSKFYFTLPVLSTAESESQTIANSDAPLILVCDDDADIRFVLQTTLEQQGYRAIAVASGQEAIQQAIANHPDVIILNLMMPGMDGWETLGQLKQHEETQNIPAIVLSGLLPDNREVPHPGVNDWIVKPPDRQLLSQALEKALAKQNQKIKVLVVEDDLDLAQLLMAMFERYGIDTFYARTGREAIQLSQRLLPNLLILDLGLPEGDGFAVVDWLRHHNRLCHVPLVVYTSRDLSQSDRDRLKLGQTTFLTKARITPQEFERRVINLLNRIVRVKQGETHS